MNTALEQMISNYPAENMYDKKNAVKEIIQEIVLCGLSQGTRVNLRHLQQRLIDSGYLKETEPCAIEDVRKMLCNRFDSIDYTQAKQDVLPFISNEALLDIWSSDFFKQITEGLSAVEN